MKYTVRYYQDGQPHIHTQTIDAETPQVLRDTFMQQGKVVLHIKPQQTGFNTPLFRRKTTRDYSIFSSELRTLLHAGMTVVEAVDTLAITSKDNGVHIPAPAQKGLAYPNTIAQHLLSNLSQGQSLSQALDTMGDVPTVLLAAVRAGERTSNLAQSLDDYLRYHDLIQQLRGKIISAAIYPTLVTVLGLSIVIFLMTVVMPNFSHMYASLRGNASGLTSWVIGISHFVNQYRMAVYAVLALLIITAMMWVLTGKAKQQLIALAWRIKPLRSELEHFQLAMLYQTLHVLIKGGYPVTDAMRIAAQASLNPQMKAALNTALHTIEQGKPIAQTLYEQGLCNEVDKRLMRAAERNGDFHRVVNVVSGMHRDRFTLFVERLTRIIEPILLLIVAIMVGTVVVVMYLPIFEFSTQLR